MRTFVPKAKRMRSSAARVCTSATGAAVRMARVIPGARLMIVPGSHGDYLGELAASGGDLRAMRTAVPYLLRFLED